MTSYFTPYAKPLSPKITVIFGNPSKDDIIFVHSTASNNGRHYSNNTKHGRYKSNKLKFGH